MPGTCKSAALSHTHSHTHTQVPGLCAGDLQVELLRPRQTSRQMSYATYRLHFHRQGTYYISTPRLLAVVVQMGELRSCVPAWYKCQSDSCLLLLHQLRIDSAIHLHSTISLSLSLSLSHTHTPTHTHTHTHTHSPCSSAKQRSGSCPSSLPPGLVLTLLA